MPVDKRAASAWVEVDLAAVGHNIGALRAVLSPQCAITAVVKSDAYGHGMLRVARVALAAGADELAVAGVHEGAALRAAGIHAPILVAGPIGLDEAHAVVQHGLIASVGCIELATALAQATRRYLPVQLEVDTGMTRHGIAPSGLGSLVESIEARGRLAIAGVYSHFAPTSADDLPEMRAQLRRFEAAVAAVRSLRGVPRHICNTLGARVLPEAWLDRVRIGGGMLGFDPAPESRGIALAPALSLKAQVVGLRRAEVGERVGYGGTFVCGRTTRLALLPIGYGDGLARELWRGAQVLVRGRRAPIVGEISMNQTVVDVTDLPEIVFGEEVVLLGAMGTDRVRADDLVPPGGCVYEVTALLSSRLPRRYLGGDLRRQASATDLAQESRRGTRR